MFVLREGLGSELLGPNPGVRNQFYSDIGARPNYEVDSNKFGQTY